MLALTHRQLNTSRQRQLRLIAKDVIEKTVPTMDIDGFVQATCYGKINSDICLLYTSPSPRDATLSRMPSSA